jgi:hypothetical protein
MSCISSLTIWSGSESKAGSFQFIISSAVPDRDPLHVRGSAIQPRRSMPERRARPRTLRSKFSSLRHRLGEHPMYLANLTLKCSTIGGQNDPLAAAGRIQGALRHLPPPRGQPVRGYAMAAGNQGHCGAMFEGRLSQVNFPRGHRVLMALDRVMISTRLKSILVMVVSFSKTGFSQFVGISMLKL